MKEYIQPKGLPPGEAAGGLFLRNTIIQYANTVNNSKLQAIEPAELSIAKDKCTSWADKMTFDSYISFSKGLRTVFDEAELRKQQFAHGYYRLMIDLESIHRALTMMESLQHMPVITTQEQADKTKKAIEENVRAAKVTRFNDALLSVLDYYSCDNERMPDTLLEYVEQLKKIPLTNLEYYSQIAVMEELDRQEDKLHKPTEEARRNLQEHERLIFLRAKEGKKYPAPSDIEPVTCIPAGVSVYDVLFGRLSAYGIAELRRLENLDCTGISTLRLIAPVFEWELERIITSHYPRCSPGGTFPLTVGELADAGVPGYAERLPVDEEDVALALARIKGFHTEPGGLAISTLAGRERGQRAMLSFRESMKNLAERLDGVSYYEDIILCPAIRRLQSIDALLRAIAKRYDLPELTHSRPQIQNYEESLQYMNSLITSNYSKAANCGEYALQDALLHEFTLCSCADYKPIKRNIATVQRRIKKTGTLPDNQSLADWIALLNQEE